MLSETTDAVLRTLAASYILLAADAGGDLPPPLCPVCHDDYVHPAAVRILPPGRAPGLLAATSDGVAIDPNVRPTGRGVVITLTFVGECGHTFIYEFAFHKGQTFVRRRPGRDIGPCEAPDTIWRNCGTAARHRYFRTNERVFGRRTNHQRHESLFIAAFNHP